MPIQSLLQRVLTKAFYDETESDGGDADGSQDRDRECDEHEHRKNNKDDGDEQGIYFCVVVDDSMDALIVEEVLHAPGVPM